MQVIHNTPDGVNKSSASAGIRLLQGGCLPLLASPFAFPVAGVCLWLLAHLFLVAYRGPGEGHDWGLLEMAGWAGCTIVLMVMAALAIGHIVLMGIAGWRDDRS